MGCVIGEIYKYFVSCRNNLDAYCLKDSSTSEAPWHTIRKPSRDLGEKYRFTALKFDDLKRGGARVQSESSLPKNLDVHAAPSSGECGRQIYL